MAHVNAPPNPDENPRADALNPAYLARYFAVKRWMWNSEEAKRRARRLRRYDEATIEWHPEGRCVTIQRWKTEAEENEQHASHRNRDEVDEAIRAMWDAMPYGVELETVPDAIRPEDIAMIFRVDSDQKGGGKRGRCHGLSAQSRRRLMTKLSKVHRDAVPLFLTLTYHREEPSCEDVKRHLHAFVEWFRYYMEGSSGQSSVWSMVWRLEFQERGVPHLHILIYGPDTLGKAGLDALKGAWYRISGEKAGYEHRVNNPTTRRDYPPDLSKLERVFSAPAHRHFGSGLERAKDREDLLWYLSKYVYKRGEYDANPEQWTGRMWGLRNKKNMPWAHVIAEPIRLDWRDASELIRQMLMKWNGSEPDYIPAGLRIYTDDPATWVKEHVP